MIAYKLSICIPTYNRRDLLKDALESIYSQLTGDLLDSVEIVISDNASTDSTDGLIKEYSDKYKNIIYFRWHQNMGPDRNYLKVIELAHGEYCWFFGSDDILLSGGVEKVFTELNNNRSDIILFDRCVSDVTLTATPELTSWSSLGSPVLFHTKDEPEKFIQYIEACTSFGGVFSFLSVIVFRKNRWDAVQDKDRFVGSAYVHVHALFYVMSEGANFTHIKYPLVLCRLGNDTFCPDQSWESVYRRLKLDVDGYRMIVFHVFGSDTLISKKMLELIEKLLDLGTLVGIRMYLPKPQGAPYLIDNLLLNSGFFRKYSAMRSLVFFKKCVRVMRCSWLRRIA